MKQVNWRPGKVFIATEGVSGEIDGYVSDDCPGVGVHVQTGSRIGWAITHMATGRLIAESCTQMEAVSVASVLAITFPLGEMDIPALEDSAFAIMVLAIRMFRKFHEQFPENVAAAPKVCPG